jgi:hypothetical protein
MILQIKRLAARTPYDFTSQRCTSPNDINIGYIDIRTEHLSQITTSSTELQRADGTGFWNRSQGGCDATTSFYSAFKTRISRATL